MSDKKKKEPRVHKGTITDWNRAKEHGYIQPDDSKAPKIYFDNRAYKSNSIPKKGDSVLLTVKRLEDGSFRATTVKSQFEVTSTDGNYPAIARSPPRPSSQRAPTVRVKDEKERGSELAESFKSTLFLLLALIIVAFWFYVICTATPLFIKPYALFSVMLFLRYFFDSNSQKKHHLPSSIHIFLLAAIGGWPGGLLGRQLFNDAVDKNLTLWVAILINMGFTAYAAMIDPSFQSIFQYVANLVIEAFQTLKSMI